MPDRSPPLGPMAASAPVPVALQTRFVAVKQNPLETLLPYVLAAVEPVGGAAVVVRGNAASDSGLQLTVPPQFMEFLVETIATYEGTSPNHPQPVVLADFPSTWFTPPWSRWGCAPMDSRPPSSPSPSAPPTCESP